MPKSHYVISSKRRQKQPIKKTHEIPYKDSKGKEQKTDKAFAFKDYLLSSSSQLLDYMKHAWKKFLHYFKKAVQLSGKHLKTAMATCARTLKISLQKMLNLVFYPIIMVSKMIHQFTHETPQFFIKQWKRIFAVVFFIVGVLFR